MKKRSITSIDVGTTKICTTIAEVNDNGDAYVVGVGVTPSNGLHKGLVVNINEAREAIRASVRKAEQACNYKVESAYLGVTGRHVAEARARQPRMSRPAVALAEQQRPDHGPRGTHAVTLQQPQQPVDRRPRALQKRRHGRRLGPAARPPGQLEIE